MERKNSRIAVLLAVAVAMLLVLAAVLAYPFAVTRQASPPGVPTVEASGEHAPAAAPAVIRPVASDYTVCLQPLGSHDPDLLAPVGRGIEQAYGFRVHVLAGSALPAAAWYPPRRRYRALLLLDHLRDNLLPADAGCQAVLGLTDVDISITKGEHPDWGLLGLAYQGGRVGVVSSFRMRRDADHRRIAERAVKVVLHELGHVVGVPHRNDGPTCLMNDAGGSVQTVDRASGALCDGEREAAGRALGIELPASGSLDWDLILGP